MIIEGKSRIFVTQILLAFSIASQLMGISWQ